MDLVVVGGGLAGAEAAWQAAQRGCRVTLYEMRPLVNTGAHVTASLAEVVCSNSFGSMLPDRASGLLKNELELLGSLLLGCAKDAAIPAGGALAVDRTLFSQLVTDKICGNSNIELVREEVTRIPPGPAVIASGPLTSPALSSALAELTGSEHLFFYDAIAPIVYAESINMEIAYRGSRYGVSEQPDGDYINCPLDEAQYHLFVAELQRAERIALKNFENEIDSGVQAGEKLFFEGCLPVEVIAQRGEQSLAFGPLRPVGLRNPHTGRRPYAVVQLRQDNLAGSLYNMVGFQTNLTSPEQERAFRLIPGLENAEFARFGQMHRNTFIASPQLLEPTLQFKSRPDLFFAGQITGVEGYLGNIATGLLAGVNLARRHAKEPPLQLPPTTMLGALCSYITQAEMRDFQPMKANFGILPPLDQPPRVRKDRNSLYAKRAVDDLKSFLAASDFTNGHSR